MLALALSAPPAAGAQEPAGHTRRLEVSVGLSSVAVLDQVASPLPYGGAEPMLQLGYAALGARSRFGLRVGAATATLTSDQMQRDLPHEQEVRGWIEGEYLRRLGGGGDRTQWLVGGMLAVRGSERNHYYAGPLGAVQDYGFATAELAPVVAAERRLASGAALSARLGVTVLGVVARPYSNLSGPGLPLRVVAPDRLQAIDLLARYTRPIGTGAALLWDYRLVVERFADAEPYRAATQSLSLSISLRVGGRP